MAENQDPPADPNSDPPEIDLSDPRVKAVLDQQVDEAVKGLKKTNQELKQEKSKLQQNHQKLLEDLGGEEGIEELKQTREKLSQFEDADLLKNGKVDEVVNKRTESLRKQYEQKLEKQQQEAQQAAQERDSYRQQYERQVLNVSIRDAAQKAGVRSEAMGDAVALASLQFKVHPDYDQPVIVEDDVVQVGPDGKTPKTLSDWFEERREQTPYLFPASAGGGAGGSGKGGAKAKKRSEMSSAEKAAYIGEHGREAYINLPE